MNSLTHCLALLCVQVGVVADQWYPFVLRFRLVFVRSFWMFPSVFLVSCLSSNSLWTFTLCCTLDSVFQFGSLCLLQWRNYLLVPESVRRSCLNSFIPLPPRETGLFIVVPVLPKAVVPGYLHNLTTHYILTDLSIINIFLLAFEST